LDRFGKVLRFEIFGSFEIRNGAGHFENPNNSLRGWTHRYCKELNEFPTSSFPSWQ
jgi:hypothetical protein